MSFYTIYQWIYLSWIDIKGRYKRTFFGPFWLVITTFITIAMLGVVYGSIFKVDLNEYIPYIAAGIVSWTLIQGNIMESSNALISYKFILLTKPIPVPMIIIRIISRNLIIFAHNMIVLILCLIYFGRFFDILFLFAIGGIVINSLIAIALGIILSLICARFRDLVQLISALMSMMFLVTPIVWDSKLLESRDYLAEWNIFTHLIELIRAPLLGEVPSLNSFTISILLLIVLSLLAWYSIVKFRKFIYWL